MSDDKPKRQILREMQEAAPGGIQPLHIDMVCEAVVIPTHCAVCGADLWYPDGRVGKCYCDPNHEHGDPGNAP